MVKIKTFIEGFDDLERLYEVKREIDKTRHRIRRCLIDTSLGSLDDRSIITDEERQRFFKLADALDKAAELLRDKIHEQEKKCIRMNVTGFTEEEPTEKEVKDESEFF